MLLLKHFTAHYLCGERIFVSAGYVYTKAPLRRKNWAWSRRIESFLAASKSCQPLPGRSRESFPPRRYRRLTHHLIISLRWSFISTDMSLKCVLCTCSYQTRRELSCFMQLFQHKSFRYEPSLQLERNSSICSKACSYWSFRAPRWFVESPQICGIWGILLYFTACSDTCSPQKSSVILMLWLFEQYSE